MVNLSSNDRDNKRNNIYTYREIRLQIHSLYINILTSAYILTILKCTYIHKCT